MKQVNNWIVWHRGTGNIFKSESEAMNFIYAEREKSPNYIFNGWRETYSGSNMGTILSSYDEVHQLEEQQRYQRFFAAPTDSKGSENA